MNSNNKMKRILTLCITCLIACNLIACGNRVEKYTSPSGDNRIKVKYDFVSRPALFYNGDCIWEYPGRGFNEEVFFEVEWVDDDTVKMIYNDESHGGKYYEEFEIDL